MKAVIPAGGNGTRMFDRTNNGQVLKEYIEVAGVREDRSRFSMTLKKWNDRIERSSWNADLQ